MLIDFVLVLVCWLPCALDQYMHAAAGKQQVYMKKSSTKSLGPSITSTLMNVSTYETFAIIFLNSSALTNVSILWILVPISL